MVIGVILLPMPMHDEGVCFLKDTRYSYSITLWTNYPFDFVLLPGFEDYTTEPLNIFLPVHNE